MIDIHNKIFRNTFGCGFSTLMEVAANNALHSRYSSEISIAIRISDIREPIIDTINSTIKMRVDRKILNYGFNNGTNTRTD